LRFAATKRNPNDQSTTTMAKSKTVAKNQEAPVDAPLTTKVANGTPYQLDPAQVERAAKALVSHMKKHVEEQDEKAAVKNLADDEDEAEDNDQPIFLGVSTKKQINSSKSMKPTKMSVYATQCAITAY
jgi:ribosome biogenesis protein UTP30